MLVEDKGPQPLAPEKDTASPTHPVARLSAGAEREVQRLLAHWAVRALIAQRKGQQTNGDPAASVVDDAPVVPDHGTGHRG